MSIVKSHINLDVNSDPLTGVVVSANKARIDLTLEQPIQIPAGAFNVTVRVEEATVWNTVFNVSAGLNNNHIFITDNAVQTDVTIPDGTYSTQELSVAINREYADALVGAVVNMVTLQEDFPTQRVVLVLLGSLSTGQVEVDFTPNNTFRDLIGFNSQVVTAVNPNDIAVLADNVAKFNNIEYFLIHWSGGEGIRVNNTFDQVLTRVNIDSPPGTQIVSQPFNPARSDAQAWAGDTRTFLQFWLTDQTGADADTGEIWSARMVFEWEQMVQSQEVQREMADRTRVYQMSG